MLFLDFSTDYQLLFQDPATPMMNGIIDLHHYIMFFLFVILVFVVVMLSSVVELFVFLQNPKKVLSYNIIPAYLLSSRYSPQARQYFFKKVKDYYSNPSNKWSVVKDVASWNNVWSELILSVNPNTSLSTNVKFSVKSKKVCLIKNLSSNLSYFKNNLNSIPVINENNTIANSKSFFIASVFYTNKISTKKGFYLVGEEEPAPYVKKFAGYILNLSLPRMYKLPFLYPSRIKNIFKSYVLNSIYWMHTYLTLRSGINNFTHSTIIEIVWTVIPSLVLICIGVPSFILLYAMDEIIEPDFVVKCIGHQWYWSYEIEYPDFFFNMPLDSDTNNNFLKNKNVSLSDFVANERMSFEDCCILANSNSESFSLLKNEADFLTSDSLSLNWKYISFNSYMLNENDLEVGRPRLLEVDNPLILPVKTHVDILVTANDVLHSWAVPSFGIKMDAVPGRLNHANIFIERSGTFYGQCSEICGVNHGFMPIKIIAVSLTDFLDRICFMEQSPFLANIVDNTTVDEVKGVSLILNGDPVPFDFLDSVDN